MQISDVAAVQYAVPIVLRDGTKLNAVIIAPKPAGQRRPTILIQSPYDPAKELGINTAILSGLVRAGYGIVVVNVRGTQWSDGSAAVPIMSRACRSSHEIRSITTAGRASFIELPVVP